ncbi:unnamed protein product, partial [Didymodactylos carnosus]
ERRHLQTEVQMYKEQRHQIEYELQQTKSSMSELQIKYDRIQNTERDGEKQIRVIITHQTLQKQYAQIEFERDEVINERNQKYENDIQQLQYRLQQEITISEEKSVEIEKQLTRVYSTEIASKNETIRV